MPDYYGDFIAQADRVRDHLTAVGEPEMTSVGGSGTSGVGTAEGITAAFAQAAHRHRHPSAGPADGSPA